MKNNNKYKSFSSSLQDKNVQTMDNILSIPNSLDHTQNINIYKLYLIHQKRETSPFNQKLICLIKI